MRRDTPITSHYGRQSMWGPYRAPPSRARRALRWAWRGVLALSALVVALSVLHRLAG